MIKKIKDMTLFELVRTCEINRCDRGCDFCPLYHDFFDGFCYINDLNEYYDKVGDFEVEVANEKEI